MIRRNWQRHELLVALNLYCRLPFGQYHSRNPEIIRVANLIDRTPDALAMKLSNFASFDPIHQSRGIKGLGNTSQADRAIWNEFTSNWDDLAVESELIYAQLSGSNDDAVTHETMPQAIEKVITFSGPTEAERKARIRIGQSFFRAVILASYAKQCCICGMPIPELLIASHIVAWSDDENLRVNPRNGLCLCTLHDKGFDRGLFTLGASYEVILGAKIEQYLPDPSVQNGFKAYDGRRIRLPDKFIPDQGFLSIHRTRYFLG